MRRLIQIFALLLLPLIGSALAFSLLGPRSDDPGGEAWQVERIGYNIDGSEGSSKNLGEEYRWNQSVITYGFDPAFVNYFGSNGIAAVEAAVAVFNSLPDVSTLSQALTEYPLIDPMTGATTTYRDSREINYTARALILRDLKTYAMGSIAEQLGLASPERWTWALRGREIGPGPAPTNYLTIMRNFDPVTYMPSRYVNGTRYTYTVTDGATISDAVEIPADPESTLYSFTSVANIIDGNDGVLGAGEFFTYLTRDDIGGLRYLYDPVNLNWEGFAPGTQITAPDFTSITLITNLDLFSFSSATLTNPPAALLTLFPDLIIRPGFPVPFVTNEVRLVQVVLTNSTGPWDDPFNTNQIFLPIFTTNVAIRFLYQFENVITNYFTPTTTIRRIETGVVREPWSTPDNPIYRSNVTTEVVPIPSGAVIIIPTNVSQFNFTGISNAFVTVVTNVLFSTNVVENGLPRLVQITEEVLVTNVIFGVFPFAVQPAPESVLRGGIGKINLQRLTSAIFTGTNFLHTNVFTATFLTNAFGTTVLVTNTFSRVGQLPDILFGAADLGITPNTATPVTLTRGTVRINNGNLNSSLANQGGPGINHGPNNVIFSKVGPSFHNEWPRAVTEASATPFLFWGSFDGSTNAPIVYPKDITLEDVSALIHGGLVP
jgi:hypothetical protein